MAPIQFVVIQARSINHFKNIRTKILKFCVNIYFNKYPIQGAHYCYLVCVTGWPDDGFNKAETCCHLTNIFSHLLTIIFCV
jgi:hypothetical protein